MATLATKTTFSATPTSATIPERIIASTSTSTHVITNGLDLYPNLIIFALTKKKPDDVIVNRHYLLLKIFGDLINAYIREKIEKDLRIFFAKNEELIKVFKTNAKKTVNIQRFIKSDKSDSKIRDIFNILDIKKIQEEISASTYTYYDCICCIEHILTMTVYVV